MPSWLKLGSKQRNGVSKIQKKACQDFKWTPEGEREACKCKKKNLQDFKGESNYHNDSYPFKWWLKMCKIKFNWDTLLQSFFFRIIILKKLKLWDRNAIWKTYMPINNWQSKLDNMGPYLQFLPNSFYFDTTPISQALHYTKIGFKMQ